MTHTPDQSGRRESVSCRAAGCVAGSFASAEALPNNKADVAVAISEMQSVRDAMRAALLVVACGFTALGPFDAFPKGADSGICGRSTQHLLQACQHEAANDYRVGVAICLNVGDAAEVEECLDANRSTRAEALEECADSREVRHEACEELGPNPYDPVIDPANFGARINNPHAQDKQGNVWYFGELSKNYEDGVLANLDGSFEAGKDGAKPGLWMKAAPQVGDFYRQEWAPGNAEDVVQVQSVNAPDDVPFRNSKPVLMTRDLSPQAPGAEELKFYVPGVGFVLEVELETGEKLELVDYSR